MSIQNGRKVVVIKILDVCCGSKMFWYDNQESHTTYMDIRKHYEKLSSGHVVNVNLDIQADFKNIPFSDCTFDLVVFDPPHLIHVGKTSWLAEKYGVLPKNWQPELKAGFDECQRVLKTNGVLLFKWNDDQIKFSEVLKAFGQRPILGDKRSKTKWSVFFEGVIQ